MKILKVAAHADITDDDQTIKVKTPEIGTTASFEGEKEIDPLDKVTLTDTVSYKDLTPGKGISCNRRSHGQV